MVPMTLAILQTIVCFQHYQGWEVPVPNEGVPPTRVVLWLVEHAYALLKYLPLLSYFHFRWMSNIGIKMQHELHIVT